MIVALKVRLADIMEKAHDANALVGERRVELLELFVHSKGMDGQSTRELVMRFASRPEIVAVLQIPDDLVHAGTTDLLQQREYLLAGFTE